MTNFDVDCRRFLIALLKWGAGAAIVCSFWYLIWRIALFVLLTD